MNERRRAKEFDSWMRHVCMYVSNQAGDRADTIDCWIQALSIKIKEQKIKGKIVKRKKKKKNMEE